MPEDIQRRETVGGNAEIAGRREVGNPGLDRIVDGAIEGTLGVAGLGHQLAILIDAEHADVVDNDLNMLGLQVFDGLRIRARRSVPYCGSTRGVWKTIVAPGAMA